MAERFLNSEGSSSSTSTSVVDVHKKVELKVPSNNYISVVEKLDAKKHREMGIKEAAMKAPLPLVEDAWWKLDPDEIKEEEQLKQLLQRYEEFSAELSEALIRKMKD